MNLETPLVPGDLVDEHEAAAVINTAVPTLRNWRTLKKGPKYYKIGQRLVRYHRADLAEFIAKSREDAPYDLLEKTHGANAFRCRVLAAINAARIKLQHYSQTTDSPDWHIVDAADLLDAAYELLASRVSS